MALTIDSSRALRGTEDLRILVRAIVGAGDHDEADWVEWKSDLDLTSKAGGFAIARAILGMANRLPERAAATCEGLGFIVVGAAPGGLRGVTSLDPAILDQLVEPYVGGALGPRWTPSYVPEDGVTVLILTVEPPQAGDRIFPLRKEFDGTRSGTVFVRKHGRTERADARDLDALQDRLVSAPRDAASLAVRAVGDIPLSWVDPQTARAAIDRWADSRRERLVAQARALEQERQQPESAGEVDLTSLPNVQATFAAVARQQDSLRRAMRRSGLLDEEDARTLDEYLDEVDRWRDELVLASGGAWAGVYAATGHGVVALEVENLGSRFLPDVELEVRFDFAGVSASDEEPEWPPLPPPPRAYGEPKPKVDFLSEALMSRFGVPYVPNMPGPARRTWVEGGSVVLRFRIGDLRQHATDTSDAVYVIVTERPHKGLLRGDWKATVRDVEGVLTGEINVPVADKPTDVVELLSREPRDD